MSNEEINNRIKIQSTEFDRKRKLDDKSRNMLRKEYSAGVSVSVLSAKYGISAHTVKYNADDTYRKLFNQKRSGGKYKDNHTGRTIFFDDLAMYKKSLVKSNKLKVSDLF